MFCLVLRVDHPKVRIGARNVPTAGLVFEGTRAELEGEPVNDTRAIEPMLA